MPGANVMYFETGQGAALSGDVHFGVDHRAPGGLSASNGHDDNGTVADKNFVKTLKSCRSGRGNRGRMLAAGPIELEMAQGTPGFWVVAIMSTLSPSKVPILPHRY
jgi:hypothetical protein